MRLAFYMNIVSPHQLPLASEIVRQMGMANFRYIYHHRIDTERAAMGWSSEIYEWCLSLDSSEAREWLEQSEVLICGLRELDLFERRCAKNLKTFYTSERWFKPPIGFLRIFVPSYFKMARRIVKLLNESENFYYLPMGIHAARDMARLCGLMNGDLRCLFKAPKLEFERKPGGKVFSEGVRECVGKMRMWGYFVQSSEFRVGSLELNHGIHGIHGKKGCGSEGVKVLWVGRLLDLKRVDTIIKAVGECSKSKKITLDVYGVGPEEAKLKKLAAKYGDVIKFYPPVPINEVRKLMREHDVYVLSSNGYEGWGAVVSEALEEGMAVIGAYEAGASAAILPRERLYHAGDVNALALLLEKEYNNELPQCSIGEWTAKNAAKRLMEMI